jgi:hypothetical protein
MQAGLGFFVFKSALKPAPLFWICQARLMALLFIRGSLVTPLPNVLSPAWISKVTTKKSCRYRSISSTPESYSGNERTAGKHSTPAIGHLGPIDSRNTQWGPDVSCQRQRNALKGSDMILILIFCRKSTRSLILRHKNVEKEPNACVVIHELCGRQYEVVVIVMVGKLVINI